MKRTRPPDEPVEIDDTSELEFSSTDTSADPDSNFEPGDWHHRRSDNCKLTPQVSKNIFDGNVSVIATVSDISRNVLQNLTGATLQDCGVEITKCKASASTALRKMKKTAEETAEIAKLDAKKAVEESPYPCIIHFDGKTLFEMNQGKRLKNERLAVLVNIEGESHLLEVPALNLLQVKICI